ncbi:MAG: peptidylprolyl isomerase [Xanthomonadales bacterium]|nr:peptidylprolyl isomerase [Xanthomonadales bacterium]
MKLYSGSLITLLSSAMLAWGNGASAQEDGSDENTQPSSNPRAVIHTSMGDITLELFAQEAPVTVENFIAYANDGFYNGTVFHRVISHFMIQGGGLTADLKTKPTADPIVNESSNGISNGRGTVAMARTSDPDSATSQFFINVQDNPNLDNRPMAPGYTVFGKVVGGMEVVDEIRFVETTSNPPYHDVPVEPVVIESVEITAAE